jgi:hypothetical protein
MIDLELNPEQAGPEWHEEADLLREENLKLKNILAKLLPDKTGHYFICGESGEKDRNGMPEGVILCAAYGSDAVYHYKRVD